MKTHLAFVVNHAAFFISHRLPIAIAALERGYSVDLYTGLAASPGLERAAVVQLSRYPITHWRVKFTSSSINPLSEGAGILDLARHLRRRRPDIVHCVSPKGVIYGGIAARLARAPAFVAAVSGQGYAFTDGESNSRRIVARQAYSLGSRLAFAHRHKRVIVQNVEDRGKVVEAGLARADQVELIPGSGVDLGATSVSRSRRGNPSSCCRRACFATRAFTNSWRRRRNSGRNIRHGDSCWQGRPTTTIRAGSVLLS